MALGAFTYVLHSHLPYCRRAGRWPHGEEWVHEAILGTYLPLLGLLHDLRDDGVPYQITIGLTPTLIEQRAHHHKFRHDRGFEVRVAFHRTRVRSRSPIRWQDKSGSRPNPALTRATAHTSLLSFQAGTGLPTCAPTLAKA